MSEAPRSPVRTTDPLVAPEAWLAVASTAALVALAVGVGAIAPVGWRSARGIVSAARGVSPPSPDGVTA